MPKTKEQKHKEAIERARSLIPLDRATMMSYQTGGDNYNAIAALEGNDRAADSARKALKEFKAKCLAAKVDTHGNPI